MSRFRALGLRNRRAVPLDAIPVEPMERVHESVVAAVAEGWRLAAFFGMPEGSDQTRLIAILADDAGGELGATSAIVGDRYPSLSPACPQAHGFEREIAEQCGVVPEGHPWLKPLRRHPPDHLAPGRRADSLDREAYPFFRVEGEEVHEVAVGPVHAGIIEPGHFRFQCHGETVLHLEISLGYQHRGVETALVGGPDKRTIHYMETVAGDTTTGHALAYAQAVEALAGCEPPAGAEALRCLALELERLANHAGDLGALAGDVGYLPTASYFGRIRGDFLNMTALLCGSRFGRGFIRPGGIGFDVNGGRVEQLLARMEQALHDVTTAANLLWST